MPCTIPSVVADEILVVDSIRNARRHRGQHVQHVLFALIVIGTAVNDLFHGHGSLLISVALLVSGLGVVAAMLVDHWRNRHGGHHNGVAWPTLAAIVMAFVEAVEKTHGHLHVSAAYLTPVAMTFIAWRTGGGRIASYMKATGEELEIKQRHFRPRRRIRWDRLTAYRVGSDSFDLLGNGRTIHQVKLADIRNRSEATEWLSEQCGRRGLMVEGSGATQ